MAAHLLLTCCVFVSAGLPPPPGYADQPTKHSLLQVITKKISAPQLVPIQLMELGAGKRQGGSVSENISGMSNFNLTHINASTRTTVQ